MLVFPTQSYSVRSCLPVEPEGNPGDDNNQDARAVHLWFIIITNKKVLTWKSLDFYSRYLMDLNDEVSHVSPQMKMYYER